jgi:hypothetical protein
VVIVIAAAAAWLLPASVLVLDRIIIKVANPGAKARMVVGFGPIYVLVLAIIAGYSLFTTLPGKWELWLPV